MSQYRRSIGRGSCPMSRWAMSRMHPAIPCGLLLSLHSPQPTSPPSVSIRTNVHGLQPPSQCSASTRAIFMRSSLVGLIWLEPGGEASPELIQLEQANAPALLRRRARRRCVVAPGGEEQPHVRQVGMRGDVLECLETVLDEPERGAPSVRA